MNRTIKRRPGLWLITAAISLATTLPACGFQPMLPDPKLTPGQLATSPAEMRGVTDAMRDEVFARYRVPADRRGGYVIDHLIPKELGGADAIENLWPQKINARPYTARRKQVLAAKLLELVRSGRLTLAEAQTEIRGDWILSFVTHIGMVYLSPSLGTPRD